MGSKSLLHQILISHIIGESKDWLTWIVAVNLLLLSNYIISMALIISLSYWMCHLMQVY